MSWTAGTPGPSVYQLKVTLLEIRPPIWRRLLVAGDTTLSRLHDILQAAMGWHDRHLHLFDLDGLQYSSAKGVALYGARNEASVRLAQVAGPGARFHYIYDLGDYWEHEVEVEGVRVLQPGERLPALLGGRRAAPPEDVGGIDGYLDLLEALQEPNDPENAEFLETFGDGFDPEAFDVEQYASELQAVPLRYSAGGLRST